MSIVGHVNELAYGARGYSVAKVEHGPNHLQGHCVDYCVTLESARNSSESFDLFVELKTDKNPARNIAVERWNSVETKKVGWPFKPIEVHSQRLMTVFGDGTVFYPYLDAYQCWLFDNVDRWDTEISSGSTTYRSIYLPNLGYTTEVYLVPFAEAEDALGAGCIYQLADEWLALARDAALATSAANARWLRGVLL